jgi:hypothetical protein
MSKVKDNIVTTGLSGKLGKQIVFRQWSGATFLAKAPVLSKSSVVGEARLKNKQRFKEAIIYAKKAMNDPQLKQAYYDKRKPRQTAYNVAVRDFFDAPVIEEIDLSNYTGEANSFIRIYATDDFRVNNVEVRIEDEQNQAVATGFAVREENADRWKFIVNETHALPAGGKVIASAYDMPGNETTMEANL